MRSLRGFIAGFFAGSGVVAVLATPVAKADPPAVVDYALDHALEICGGLQLYPSVPGLIGTYVQAVDRDGLSDTDALAAVNLAVDSVCPQHVPALQRFNAIALQGVGE